MAIFNSYVSLPEGIVVPSQRTLLVESGSSNMSYKKQPKIMHKCKLY